MGRAVGTLNKLNRKLFCCNTIQEIGVWARLGALVELGLDDDVDHVDNRQTDAFRRGAIDSN
jgi:hypothetical protein